MSFCLNDKENILHLYFSAIRGKKTESKLTFRMEIRRPKQGPKEDNTAFYKCIRVISGGKKKKNKALALS